MPFGIVMSCRLVNVISLLHETGGIKELRAVRSPTRSKSSGYYKITHVNATATTVIEKENLSNNLIIPITVSQSPYLPSVSVLIHDLKARIEVFYLWLTLSNCCLR